MPPKEHCPTLWADDFLFLEAPRWRQDRLWVSDVFDKKIYTIESDGRRTALHDVPHRPAGIGFLPDGSAVVVSMRDRTLLRATSDGLTLLADLSMLAAGDLNDLVIDDEGRIYVGNFGYDFHGGAPKRPTDLHVIEPDGTIHVAATGLEFPNGAVIINGGRTLVVAETWACRLTAFDRASDGKLSNGRLFASLGQREPDGICADAANGIWAACFNTGEFIRVMDGGEITDVAKCGSHAISCDLGGSDGRTLFCSAYNGTFEDMDAGKRLGAVFTTTVDTPSINFGRR
jgi:sugar lactone lactonase YvrE